MDEELFKFQIIPKTLEMGMIKGTYSQTEITAELVCLCHVEVSTLHRITPSLMKLLYTVNSFTIYLTDSIIACKCACAQKQSIAPFCNPETQFRSISMCCETLPCFTTKHTAIDCLFLSIFFFAILAPGRTC